MGREVMAMRARSAATFVCAVFSGTFFSVASVVSPEENLNTEDTEKIKGPRSLLDDLKTARQR
jgi:hypothetical protein